MPRLAMAVPGLAAVALAVAGCGGSSSSAGHSTTLPAAAPTTATTTATGAATTVPAGLSTRTTAIGTVLSTASGYTIYELVGATASHSACTGTCLSVWPAVDVNGHQVVVNGHPAYRFVGDSGPGQAKGQGLQDTWGRWWALDPAGDPITTGGGTTSTTSGSGYGGY